MEPQQGAKMGQQRPWSTRRVPV